MGTKREIMSTEKPKKVVSIEQLRKDKQRRQEHAEFRGYLKSLPQDRLQYEAEFLIGQIESEGVCDKHLTRVALLMEELASRVSGEKMTSMINEFASSIRNKLNIEVQSELLH